MGKPKTREQFVDEYQADIAPSIAMLERDIRDSHKVSSLLQAQAYERHRERIADREKQLEVDLREADRRASKASAARLSRRKAGRR